MKVKSESEVTQPCPTLSDPPDCSPPGSSVHGIFQTRVLEWGAIAFSELKHIWTDKLDEWTAQVVQVEENLPANVGVTGHTIPGSGRFPAGGNGKPCQYSCRDYPMDRRAKWATQFMGWQRVGRN